MSSWSSRAFASELNCPGHARNPKPSARRARRPSNRKPPPLRLSATAAGRKISSCPPTLTAAAVVTVSSPVPHRTSSPRRVVTGGSSWAATVSRQSSRPARRLIVTFPKIRTGRKANPTSRKSCTTPRPSASAEAIAGAAAKATTPLTSDSAPSVAANVRGRRSRAALKRANDGSPSAKTQDARKSGTRMAVSVPRPEGPSARARMGPVARPRTLKARLPATSQTAGRLAPTRAGMRSALRRAACAVIGRPLGVERSLGGRSALPSAQDRNQLPGPPHVSRRVLPAGGGQRALERPHRMAGRLTKHPYGERAPAESPLHALGIGARDDPHHLAGQRPSRQRPPTGGPAREVGPLRAGVRPPGWAVVGMVTLPEQRLGDLHQAPEQRELGQERMIAVRKRPVQPGTAEGVNAHHAVHQADGMRTEHLVEPHVRRRGGDALARRPVLPHVAVLVDDNRRAVAADHRRVGVEDLHAPGEIGRLMLVVVGGPLEVGRFGELEGPVVVPRQPVVLLGPVVTDAGVAGGVPAADLLRAVRGGVVGDDELEVDEVLREQRIELALQEPLAVAHGYSDAHPRSHGVGPPEVISMNGGTRAL